MRKLILMLGAPASGKDYWINEYGLQDYTITPDVLRSQFANPKYEVGGNYYCLTKTINNSFEREVWDAVSEAVNAHLKVGSLCIVNATHLFKSSFTRYNADRITYNYQVCVVDTMAKTCRENDYDFKKIVDQLVKSDEKRDPFKQVGRKVIGKYVQRYLNRLDRNHKLQLPNWIKYYDAWDCKDVDELLGWHKTDMSSFDRIKIIGDVHGDYDALREVFKDHKKGDAYIFVGDYLDRGTKSPEVFKFVTQELKGKNLFFLHGNHETSWEKWATTGKASGQFAYDSLPRLQAIYGDDDLKKIINQFRKHWLSYIKFNFNDCTYFVSHAGIEPFMAEGYYGELYGDDLFVEGIGPLDNPYTRDIDELWDQYIDGNCFNIHGHRNAFNHFHEGNYGNLTAEGKFRWLVIDSKGRHYHEIDRIDTQSFAQELINEEHIKQTQLGDGIVANNFDREAFKKGIWNSMTTKARGLFTRGDEIVGRGFNKFFQIGQTPDSTLDSLVYPVEVHLKHNGFLGITFWDKDKQELRVYSKAGGEHHSKLARDVLDETGWLWWLNEYYRINKENQDTTITFEIIDPVNDPHIVKYNKVHAFPLAVINNDRAGIIGSPIKRENMPLIRTEIIAKIAKNNLVGIANNEEELKDIIERFEDKNPTQEGLVLYGQNKMLKYKTKFYLKAKELRTTLGKAEHTKSKYYYGAEPWVDWCKRHGETRFSPQLALNLYELEKRGKLHENS